MKPFLAIAAIFSLPVILKATGMILFAWSCGANAVAFEMRALLPLAAFALGYLIFILEGAQTSVMFSNKRSLDSLLLTLASLQLSVRQQKRVKNALMPYLGGAPLETFIIGRQILIVVAAFLFKFAYDEAALSAAEISMLHDTMKHCPLSASVALGTYKVIDGWLFSAAACTALVAYVFQVTAKLITQAHPIRFLAEQPFAVYVPSLADRIGRWTLLAWFIVQWRLSDEAAAAEGKDTILAGHEHAPIDTQAAFDSLVGLLGEKIDLLDFSLKPINVNGVLYWHVRMEATYVVQVPSDHVGHVIYPHDRNNIVYGARSGSGAAPHRITPRVTSMMNSERTEFQAQLVAHFDEPIPAGEVVVWDADYLVPAVSQSNRTSDFDRNVFEVPILLPVRRVIFQVDQRDTLQPALNIVPMVGIQPPKCGKVMQRRENGLRIMKVDFPSINSRLQISF